LTGRAEEPVGNGLESTTSWPVRSSAVGVLRASGPSTAVAAQVGDTEVAFRWASVTKLLVTLAALVAVEEGTLALDDTAGPPGATVRHLLAHASGLGPDSTVPITAPGRRRIYSNAGFEALADVVARRAAMPFAEYLGAGVLAPLAMSGTVLEPGASPAWGARGPLSDLLRLGAELLAPRLVSVATLDGATEVAFPGLGGVLPGFGRFDPCDWGLGFEIRDGKHPHWTGTRNSSATFGHFGQSGGFLWVDPEAGLACGALCDRDFGPWAQQAWPALADAVVLRWGAPSTTGTVDR
jgi:CubicO group peptidase (beta-lactamase class C family)